MFENLSKLLKIPETANPTVKKDAVAALLKISPEALAAFEKAYSKRPIDPDGDMNSRQAVDMRHAECGLALERSNEPVDAIINRVVDELLAQTSVYVFDGNLGKTEKKLLALPAGTQMVCQEDVSTLPMELRPQLTGELMSVDIAEPSYQSLLFFWNEYMTEKNPKRRKIAYNQFRQGLDILDLDPITYEILGMNRNSMGNWLPQLVEACKGQDFFQIPATTIAKVPLSLLQLTRQEYTGLTPTTLAIVDQWAHKAFNLNDAKEYFIKTGTYSSKFDFRNAHVHGEKEVQELGEYLLYIHYQALQMASPLCTPCVYGVSTTNEWVVREFIPDKEGNPCIYEGLPLHTEYRVFVDCDSKEVLGIAPYWEPETMKHRFGHQKDANDPQKVHDYIIYKAHEETLMGRFEENKDWVVDHIKEILKGLNLTGQWSIDVMQNGDEFWIIDMAVAESSYFYDGYVPKELRRPVSENWVPQLPES